MKIKIISLQGVYNVPLICGCYLWNAAQLLFAQGLHYKKALYVALFLLPVFFAYGAARLPLYQTRHVWDLGCHQIAP